MSDFRLSSLLKALVNLVFSLVDLGIDYSKWVKLGLIDDTERLDRYWVSWTNLTQAGVFVFMLCVRLLLSLYEQDVCWPLYVGRDFCIAEPVGAKATPDLSMTDLADSDRYSDLLDLNPSGVIALDDAYERDSDIHFFYHTTSRGMSKSNSQLKNFSNTFPELGEIFF